MFYSGDARETLHQLVKEKQSFDIIFLDADKPSYKEYYKVTTQGCIVFDVCV